MPERKMMSAVRAGIFFLIFLSFWGCRMETGQKGNAVVITGSKGQWGLEVNGKPFQIKGAGVSRADGVQMKADYLMLARDMGANVVRTWGEDQGTRAYLDRARQYGLFVAAGIWLDPVYTDGKGSYANDSLYKTQVREKVLRYVSENKDHPAVLFWNIGNEVIYWTKSEEERIAFCRFLEDIIQDVHRIDPGRPVVYASAFTTAVPYIKKYVPSLDILGVNAYGGFDWVQQEVSDQLDIPYIVTEFGAHGHWDRPKDLNGIALEAADDMKAHYYKVHAHQIKSFNGYCLGGFVFHLGDTTQTSCSWWNLTHGPYPKAAYSAMKDFYQNNGDSGHSPIISDLSFSKRKNLLPGECFDLEVKLRPFDGQVRYEYFATTARDVDFFEEYPNHQIPIRVEGEGDRVKVHAPSDPGIYRIYAVVVDDASAAASTFNKSISVVNQE